MSGLYLYLVFNNDKLYLVFMIKYRNGKEVKDAKCQYTGMRKH